jgi:hypothetical protein
MPGDEGPNGAGVVRRSPIVKATVAPFHEQRRDHDIKRRRKNGSPAATVPAGLRLEGLAGRRSRCRSKGSTQPRVVSSNEATPLRNALLAGLAVLSGIRRTVDVDTALVEPERRVTVSHQRHINQQPVAPTDSFQPQNQRGQGDMGREQHGDRSDQHTGADQTRR